MWDTCTIWSIQASMTDPRDCQPRLPPRPHDRRMGQGVMSLRHDRAETLYVATRLTQRCHDRGQIMHASPHGNHTYMAIIQTCQYLLPLKYSTQRTSQAVLPHQTKGCRLHHLHAL
jgi:hypothetical protein